MDGYTQGHQKNQDTGHQEAGDERGTGQTFPSHRVWGSAHFLFRAGLLSWLGRGRKYINHTQLSSRPKYQVGHPNDHAEVDTTVGRLHTLELEHVLGRISKHSELLLVHLLAMHSLFGGLPVGQELIVTASAQGLAPELGGC